jgi:hypothetical protein
MKTYKFKVIDSTSLILAIIASMFTGVFLAIIFFVFKIIPTNNITLALVFVGAATLAIYWIGAVSIVKIKLTIDGETVSIKWLGQFLMRKEQDVKFSLDDIVNYVADFDNDEIKIVLKNGTIQNFQCPVPFATRTYFEFLSDFAFAIKQHKENIQTKIKRKVSFYETTGKLILTGVLIVFLVGFITSIILDPPFMEKIIPSINLWWVPLWLLIFLNSTKKKNKTKWIEIPTPLITNH